MSKLTISSSAVLSVILFAGRARLKGFIWGYSEMNDNKAGGEGVFEPEARLEKKDELLLFTPSPLFAEEYNND